MRQTFILALIGVCGTAMAQIPVSGYDFQDTLSPYLDTNPPHVMPLVHRTGSLPTQPYGPTVYADSTVGTTPKRVVNFAKPQFLRALHGMGHNGGGGYVNIYSIVLDVKFDNPTIGTLASLFNTNADCGDDGDSFVRWDNDGSGHPIGRLGVSGVFAGSLTPNAWHRIVITVDCTANFGFDTLLNYYVDGAFANTLEDPSGLDSRWAAYCWNDNDPTADHIDIFGDQDGDNGTGQLSLLVFYDNALPLQEVTALGPVGTPIAPNFTVVPTSLTVNLGKVTSGNLASLGADDGNTLNMCKFIVPNLGSPIIQITLSGTTTLANLLTYSFNTKAKMTSAGAFKLTGEAFNFVSSTYDSVRTLTPFNLSYGLLSVPNATFANQYRSANGTVQSRLKVQQTGPSAVILPCSAFEYSLWKLTGN